MVRRSSSDWGVSGEEVSEREGKMKPRECLRSRGGMRVLPLSRACSLTSGQGGRWRVRGAATTGRDDGGEYRGRATELTARRSTVSGGFDATETAPIRGVRQRSEWLGP